MMVSHFTGQCGNAMAVGHTRPQRLLINPPHACAASTNKGWTVATTGQEVQSHCQALATNDRSLSYFGGVSATATEPRVKRTEEDYSLTQSPEAVCESRGGRPGLPVPNSPYGLWGRKATLTSAA